MEYDIYHDESKEHWYWHCFLFVPKNTRNILLDKLKEVKSCIKWNIHFCEAKQYWESKINWCKSLLSILSSSLQQIDKSKMEPYYKKTKWSYSDDEKRLYWVYETFSNSQKFKIAIFHQENNHHDMTWYDDLSKIETSFRMWLQWAKHYLFNSKNEIIVDWIYIDWFEHYNIAHRRDFNIKNIKSKLIEKSKSFVNFKDTFHIIDWNENEDDKIFLEIIDLFLWIVRLKYLSTMDSFLLTDTRLILWEPIEQLFNKLNEWPVRMRNSRFEKFWSFSSWRIEKDNWIFTDINIKIKELGKTKSVENILTLF